MTVPRTLRPTVRSHQCQLEQGTLRQRHRGPRHSPHRKPVPSAETEGTGERGCWLKGGASLKSPPRSAFQHWSSEPR
jgi:hypothetical protein